MDTWNIESCPICMENGTITSPLMSLPCCRDHNMCQRCILNLGRPYCPFCRTNISEWIDNIMNVSININDIQAHRNGDIMTPRIRQEQEQLNDEEISCSEILQAFLGLVLIIGCIILFVLSNIYWLD